MCYLIAVVTCVVYVLCPCRNGYWNNKVCDPAEVRASSAADRMELWDVGEIPPLSFLNLHFKVTLTYASFCCHR